MVFLLLCLAAEKTALAQSPSLSDEVYADLALRGELNNVSVSFYDPSQKETISINEAKHWLPASTVKLFAAMYAFKLVSENKLDLNETVIADEKNVVPTEGVTNGLPLIQTGYSETLNTLLFQMITQSDNTAFNMMLDLLDRREITKYIQSLGLTHSAVGSKLNLDSSQVQYEFDVPGYGINTTTSDDYNKAFLLIYQNKIPGAKNLLNILKQQKINYMLPLFLPKGTIVAHKHGDLDPLYHDGGIVYRKNDPYVVSIFSNAGDPDLVAHISELIYSKNPKLVGSALVSGQPVSYLNQTIDPIVAQGHFDEGNTKVLAAQTAQQLNTQPITAADLGITAKDLSLAEPSAQLPKVIISPDSPWHFLVSVAQTVSSLKIDPKARATSQAQALLLSVAEAKNLSAKGETARANDILNNLQKNMDSLAKSSAVQNNAQAQIALQTVSETRFEILNQSLQSAPDEKRNELIHEIGQQAKNTVANVSPNTPLATNATNPTQKPLVGEIVQKNDKNVVVQTAGGQQITIPIDNQSLTVKTREAQQPSSLAQPTLEPSSAISPTPGPSLANVEVGTTVAVVGSSVGNTFAPTLILTNVPRELAAPVPVTVVKVNQTNKTMVISENGVPIQVNVGSNTHIKGADTDITFDQIKTGDTVVVHGEPLTPIAPVILPTVPSSSLAPSQTHQPGSGSQNQGSSAQPASNPTGSSPNQTPQTTSANPSKPSTQIKQGSQPSSGQNKTANPATQQPQTKTQSQPQTQPKVIQSTSIQVIQKQEHVQSAPGQNQKSQPAHQEAPKQQSAPAQSQPHQQSQPQSNNQGSSDQKKENSKK